jgi:NADPH-dependent F420 reductase
MTPAASPDLVAIVGATGALGFGLTLRFGNAGIPVLVASRDASRAVKAAERATELTGLNNFAGRRNDDAVAAASLVILAVPFAGQSPILRELRPFLRPGQVIVDATVPLASAVGGRATRLLGIGLGSAAQQTRELVDPDIGVVAALHTVSAAKLADLDKPLAEDVLLCGDDRADKGSVANLIGQIDGLRPVDAGPLEMAGIVESLTALMISLNIRYRARAGIHVTGLPEALWPPETTDSTVASSPASTTT